MRPSFRCSSSQCGQFNLYAFLNVRTLYFLSLALVRSLTFGVMGTSRVCYGPPSKIVEKTWIYVIGATVSSSTIIVYEHCECTTPTYRMSAYTDHHDRHFSSPHMVLFRHEHQHVSPHYDFARCENSDNLGR